MGGSIPGQVRTVKVQEQNGDNILSIDQDCNDYRRFYASRVRGDVEILDPVLPGVPVNQVNVYFTDARCELMAALPTVKGEQLAELYGKVCKPDACEVRWDGVNGNIVCLMPEKTFNVNGQTLTLTQLRQLIAQES